MQFGETHVVDERRRFATEVQRSLKSFSAICQRYGISRPTGYTWLKHGKVEALPVAVADRLASPGSFTNVDFPTRSALHTTARAPRTVANAG
jgi:hypothetical protein